MYVEHGEKQENEMFTLMWWPEDCNNDCKDDEDNDDEDYKIH